MSPTPPDIPGIGDLEFLAAGGFGEVFTGRAGDREVVVKVARRPGDLRLAREAAALRRLGAPHTPELFDTGTLGSGQPYLIMERIRGRSLRQLLAERPDHGVLARLFSRLCDAVDAVHQAQMIHRDLKPENIVIRDDGSIALLDFGLADAAGESPPLDDTDLTTAGQRLGTAVYMSPEQCLGERRVDHRSDLYALGILLYELAVGAPPFSGSSAEIHQSHVSRRPPPASSRAPVPPSLDDVLARALDKRPERRFQSAPSLGRAAAEALAAEPTAPGVERVRPARRGAVKVALLGVETSRPVSWLETIGEVEGGLVAASTRGWYVLAFADAPSLRAGVRAALRTAAAMGTDARRAVAHVAPVRVRRRRGADFAIGRAIEVVDWANDAPAEPLALTAPAAEQVRGLVTPAAGGYHRLRQTGGGRGDTLRSARLRGREQLVAEIVESATRALDGARPGVFTLIGERGHGKSRVAREVIAKLRERDVRVVAISGADPEHGESEVIQALLRFAFDLPEAPTRSQVVDAIAARLPDAPPPLLPAAISALGVAPVSGLDATAYASPAASRQTLAGGLGEALRLCAIGAPLAIVLDDAHWADPVGLDALEIAAMSGFEAPIWLLVTAQPLLEVLRPTWGSRAGCGVVRKLGPLSAEAATALLLDLLQPAEYVPDPAIAELLAMTERVPLHLVELARELHAEGVIRRLEGTESHYLAVEELQHMRGTALGAHIAERAWNALPAELHRMLSLCAVLGDSFDASELEAVDRLCDPPGDIEPNAALEQIVRAGLLLRVGTTGYRFRHPTVREALDSMISARERIALNDAARRYLEPFARTYPLKLRLARHLRSCHEIDAAIRAYVELGDEATSRHRTMEAEQHYSAAIDLCGDRRDRLWLRAASGRGKTRGRLHHYTDALADLRAALAVAEDLGDHPAAASLCLEEAIILDWAGDSPAAAAAVLRGRRSMAGLTDEALEARLMAAEGRMCFRADDPAGAVAAFVPAIAMARRLGDRETTIDALMLLAPALVYLGELEASLQRYHELLDLCEAVGDRMHLGAAYSNRMTLWIKEMNYQRGLRDARRAMELAREVGNVNIERGAHHNLAELLLWLGELDEALPNAIRAAEIEQRYITAPDSKLLLARVRSARGEHELSRQLASELRAIWDKLSPVHKLLLRSVELSCPGARPTDWGELVDLAKQLTLIDERFEILYACASANRGASFAEELIEEALGDLPSGSPWRDRFGRLRG